MEDPLRLMAISPKITPIDEGRICVTGSFGRGWIAIAQFEPTKRRATVKVIHEAPSFPARRNGKKLWMNKNMTFQPMYARTLRGAPEADGKVPVRIVVGRGDAPANTNNNAGFVGMHPLVVNPEISTVEVMQQELYPFHARHTAAAADGSMVAMQPSPVTPGKVRFWRVDHPGIVHELESLAVPKSFDVESMGVANNLIHFAIRTSDRTDMESTRPTGRWISMARMPASNSAMPFTSSTSAIQRITVFVAWCDLSPGTALQGQGERFDGQRHQIRLEMRSTASVAVMRRLSS